MTQPDWRGGSGSGTNLNNIMSKPKQTWVSPRGNDWIVQHPGAARASAVFDTQAEAIDAGRQISQHQRTELFIQRPNGEIRDRDSHGHDPRSSRG